MAVPVRSGLYRLVTAAAVSLVAGILAGVLIASRLTPRDGSAEAGFARDMATHHAQAVDMAFAVRDASSDNDLRTLAADIIVTQSAQRGIFMGWLQQWGLPQASTVPRMAWMPGHAAMTRSAGGPVLMHGMATEEELRRLHDARGTEAEVLFLQLMIRHHEGGVMMARAVRDLSTRREVVDMAASVEDSQQAEIDAMEKLLAARGARPFASLLD